MTEAPVRTPETQQSLVTLFSELTDGVARDGGAFIVNSGDIGLLASLDRLSHAEASRNVDGGATVGAHVRHLRFGLSLMNRWAEQGGDPFADARWDEAWKTTAVTEEEWVADRRALREEAMRWQASLAAPRDVAPIELNGMIASVAHLAYHMGAIRQIAKATRGPKDGAFA